MAIYDRSFTPVADLKERRRKEEALKQRLRPEPIPSSAKQAGSAWAGIGNKAMAQFAQNKAVRGFEESERDRQAKVKSQLYGEQADALQSGLNRAATAQQGRLGRIADMRKTKLVGGQQLGQQKLIGEQQLGLQSMRDKQAQAVARMKGVSKKTGLPSAKDMLTARSQLFEQFYGKGRGGKQLRDKYQGDFDKYAEEVMGSALPAQSAQTALPAPQPDPSHGTITSGGQVIAARAGGQRVNPEQYAAQLKTELPGQAAQPVIEQPKGRTQETLPKTDKFTSPLIPSRTAGEFPVGEQTPLEPMPLSGGQSAIGRRSAPNYGLTEGLKKGVKKGVKRISRFADPDYYGARPQLKPLRRISYRDSY